MNMLENPNATLKMLLVSEMSKLRPWTRSYICELIVPYCQITAVVAAT
jgi:hypothetical protein